MLEVIVVVLALFFVGFLIAKKVPASAALLFGGMLILLLSVIMGHVGDTTLFKPDAKELTHNALVDQLIVMKTIVTKNLTGSGLIIMVLFGYTAYMDSMGANNRTVSVLSRPLLSMRGGAQILLVPLTFLLVNLMSLAVPSGASLAVLLGATLYPALVGAGMTPLTAGAIIATSATIMPSPLAADSIEAANRLNMSVGDYVFGNNAKVSIPVILIMAIVHTFWQRYEDKKDAAKGLEIGNRGAAAQDIDEKKIPAAYAILPLLPLLTVLVLYVLQQTHVISFQIGLVEITFACLFVTLLLEIIRRRALFGVVSDLTAFFKGMGSAVTTVVSIIIAAGFLIEGVQQMGVLTQLLKAVSGMKGAAVLIGLAFVGVAVLLGMMTGSGLAAFFALIPVVPGVAASTGAAATALSVPLQHAASLARAGSPVAASTLISAGVAGVEPQQLLKRTLPVVFAGIASSFILSWIIL